MIAAPMTGLAVRRARPDDAPYVAWLTAVTFPLACPPGTAVETMAAHIADKLSPAQFRAWSTSSRHALVVVERAATSQAAPASESADGTSNATIVGYALVALGQPDGGAEAAAVQEATGMRGPYLELSKIYVLPGTRGTGVADLLMSGAIDAAARLAADSGHRGGLPLWLGTNGLNARAQGFYRRHGFDVVGKRTYDVGGVEHDDVVMLHTAGRR